MQKELPENTIKIFECQIKDQIKAMHYSPFLRKIIQKYATSNGWKLGSHFSHVSGNNLIFHINHDNLYEIWLNEEVDQFDELSYIIALEILNKISFTDMCFVLQQDEFIRVYTEKERLVIKVINGAYKSSEIRAILPQHL